jgi:hypothetical protein
LGLKILWPLGRVGSNPTPGISPLVSRRDGRHTPPRPPGLPWTSSLVHSIPAAFQGVRCSLHFPRSAQRSWWWTTDASPAGSCTESSANRAIACSRRRARKKRWVFWRLGCAGSRQPPRLTGILSRPQPGSWMASVYDLHVRSASLVSPVTERAPLQALGAVRPGETTSERRIRLLRTVLGDLRAPPGG